MRNMPDDGPHEQEISTCLDNPGMVTESVSEPENPPIPIFVTSDIAT